MTENFYGVAGMRIFLRISLSKNLKHSLCKIPDQIFQAVPIIKQTRLPKVIWEHAASPPVPQPTPHNTSNCSSNGHALSHSYAANAPFVTMVHPTFALKIAPSRGQILKPNYYIIPWPIQPTSPNRIQSAVLPQCTGQTDQQKVGWNVRWL